MHKKSSIIKTLLICLSFLYYAQTSFAGIAGSKHDFSATGAASPFARNYRLYSSSGVNLGNVEEICIFCHTPHSASSSDYYKDTAGGYNSTILWNRVLPVGAGAANNQYTLYSSSSLTLISVTAPTGTSLMCLSCHDGITGIAVQQPADPRSSQSLLERGAGNPYIGLIRPLDANKIGDIYWNGTDPLLGGWRSNIGELSQMNYVPGTSRINLSNDHPVSFAWVNLIPGIKTGAPTNSSLRLFGSQRRMECSTCHNVHDNTTFPPFLVMSNSGSQMCLACHDK